MLDWVRLCFAVLRGASGVTAVWCAGMLCCLCCRIWDTHNILQKTVVKPTTPSAARVGVTTVAYNSTGKLLAAGMADGALQVRSGSHRLVPTI